MLTAIAEDLAARRLMGSRCRSTRCCAPRALPGGLSLASWPCAR